MSNLPPGVTGSEYQIAGPSWEGVLARACDNDDDDLRLLTSEALIAVQYLTSAVETFDRVFMEQPDERQKIADAWQQVFRRMGSLNSLLKREAEITVRGACPFEGAVDGEGSGHTLWWTCPVCGMTHDEAADE